MSTPTATHDPIVMNTPPAHPQRSFVATWLFAWLLGGFGADRFYLGKIGTAVLKLVTAGGLGIWTLIDLIIVLIGKTKDKQGQPLTGYDQKKVLAWIVTGIVVVCGGIGGAVMGATAVAAVSAISQSAQESPDAGAASGDETAAQPTDIAAWADEKYGTFEPISLSGTGDSVVELPAGSAAGLVRATHAGTSNFFVEALDAQNENTMVVGIHVNAIGAYDGILGYGLDGVDYQEPAVSLKITADGPWTIDVAPISYASELPTAGTGDGVFLYNGDATNLALSSEAEGAFTVFEYSNGSSNAGVLVNGASPYSGTVPITAGPSVIVVFANNPWTIAQG